MSSTLHPIERKLLGALSSRGPVQFSDLPAKSGLSPDQVRRALEWLESKGMVKVTKLVSKETKFSGQTPPELKLVGLLRGATKSLTTVSLRQGFGSDQEFSAAFGRAKALGWIKVDSSTSPPGVSLGDPEGPGSLESVISSVRDGRTDSIPPEQRAIFDDLMRRGIVVQSDSTTSSVEILGKGLSEISAAGDTQAMIDRLTPESLVTASWKGKVFRPIDVEARAPDFFPGRRHPVRDFIKEVKEVYISMGFSEIEGPSVHPAFWNFDALFIPQDHPGREMQDTFYLKDGEDSSMTRKGVVERVASTHETGWKTGSRGWGYSWSVEEARRLVLRTHNTVLTVRALEQNREADARVFAVSKVYRNENLDYKHLHEFYQMDGIIVGKGLNVRHLMGFLKEFYRKLGMKDVRLWPTFFPYTEPSLQVMGYSDVVEDWVELGGSGVFRPEVTIPLGVKVPVLAWGPGIERLMLLRYGLDDLRELYSNNLDWLRKRADHAGR